MGQFRPKETNIPFWARPGPEGRAGPGSAWPSKKNGRGELFPPHPCMQNAIRSACREGKKSKNARMREKKGYLARRGRCVTGLPTSLAVLRWRPVAVSSGTVVPTTAPSGATVSHGAATFFPVPCCSFVFSRSLAISSFPSSQCWVFGVSLLCFG